MACPQVVDGGDGLQIWRVAANIIFLQGTGQWPVLSCEYNGINTTLSGHLVTMAQHALRMLEEMASIYRV
jgi:hypothetical protein